MPEEIDLLNGNVVREESGNKGGMYGQFPCERYFSGIPEALRNHFYNRISVIEAGAYPQSVRDKGVTVGGQPDENGCYTGNDGRYYVCRNGVYYLIEPLAWDVLSVEDDVALVICRNAVARLPFGRTNNYANSELRRWLNGAFFDTAFGSELKQYAMKTIVDNSAASAGSANGRTVCGNTRDVLFLLSVSEQGDGRRGLAEPTDFCGDVDFLWLRSPDETADCAVGADCSTGERKVHAVSEFGGVVPAMRISLR